jgi:hypothetical protein
MKRPLRFLIAASCCSLLLAAGAPVASAQYLSGEDNWSDINKSRDLTNIPLQWSPSETITPLDFVDAMVFKKRLKIAAFRDLRENKQEIGRNVEKNPARLVTTRDDVAAWLSSGFSSVVSELLMSPPQENGDIVLNADVLNFYVVESNKYRADITLKVTLRSAATGASLWEGTVTGKADNWGKSYKADNYMESLSNACISAVRGLLASDSFRKAFAAK